MRGKIVESTHLCYPPPWDNSATHHSKAGHQRGVDAQILHPHQSQVLTKEPHQQAVAIFDPCMQ